jgi:hypothetical protein
MLSACNRYRVGPAIMHCIAGLKNNPAMIVKSRYVNHALLEND